MEISLSEVFTIWAQIVKIREKSSSSSGDIPKNNARKCQFLKKMTRNKKLPNFLSNFQYWFRNVLQHLTEVFRPYHPCKKSLEIDFQLPKKKVFLIFPFFSRFLGVYFYKVSWLVNTCWLNVDQNFFPCQKLDQVCSFQKFCPYLKNWSI